MSHTIDHRSDGTLTYKPKQTAPLIKPFKNSCSATKDHEESVRAISFSPDSRVLISGCVLGNLRLYQLDPDYKEKLSIDCSVDNAHDLGVLCSTFCKQVRCDGSDSRTKIYTLATSGMDQFIKLWRVFSVEDVADEGDFHSRLVPQCNADHINGHSTIYSTRKMNMENILQYSAHGSSVTCLRFTESGTTLVSGSFDKTIKMWDLKGNCLITLLEHARYINCIAINSMILASGSNDRSIMIWDLTGKSTLDTPIADGVSSLFRLAASSHDDVPVEMVCAITHEIMSNPVIAEDGFTYEESALKEWFDMGKNTSPMTNLPMDSLDYIPNIKIRDRIEEYLKSFDD